MEDCLFCKIVNKQIPSTVVYEDDEILAFKDINPVAPVHVLVIPKKHITCLNDVLEEDIDVLGKIQLVIKKIAKELGVDETGYRVISNCGDDGGQLVKHLHYHLIGGKKLGAKIVHE